MLKIHGTLTLRILLWKNNNLGKYFSGQTTFSLFNKFRSYYITNHDFLLHILLISCSNRENTSCTFSSDIYVSTILLHASHIVGTSQIKIDPLGDELYNLCVIWKIIYVGFTGSNQDKYDMLPNLNQYMGGKPYLISLDPNIMCFGANLNSVPGAYTKWNLE